MLVVPAATAVTKPVLASTVATEVLVEDHAPPASPLLEYVAVCPTVSGEVPLIVPTFTLGFTTTFCCALTGAPHPDDTVYVMVAVPALTPVTCPVEALTVAMEVFELLHVPPDVPLLVKLVEAPMQIGDEPETVPADTLALTVNRACALTGEPHPLFTV